MGEHRTCTARVAGSNPVSSTMMNHIILFLIQSLHWIFLVLVGVSVPLVIICEPFYVSLPICAWIMHLTFSRVLDCPWTRLENTYRSKCGRPEIKTFIGYHLKKLKKYIF